jgi:hypothetical protein
MGLPSTQIHTMQHLQNWNSRSKGYAQVSSKKISFCFMTVLTHRSHQIVNCLKRLVGRRCIILHTVLIWPHLIGTLKKHFAGH